MLRSIFLLSCLVSVVAVKAQIERVVERLPLDSTRAERILAIDKALADRYQQTGSYDTAYLTRPQYAFTVKARMNVSGNEIATKGQRNGDPFNTRLQSPNNLSTSFGITYRGLSASFSVNPDKLSGKNHNTELNVTAYANRYGVDVAYMDSKEYSGLTDIGGSTHEFPSDIVQTRLLNISAYYAFNHRRFSYPAALTQSYIQRRSAGSWMVAMSLIGGQLKAQSSADLGNPAFTMHLADLGIGGGYGYNWVLPHDWLIHASALPTVVVASANRLETDSENLKLSYAFPELILTGRVAFLHYFNDRHFVNLTYVVYHTIRGSSQDLRLSHTKWRLRISYGFRF